MNPEMPLVILPAAGWLLWTWGGLNWKPARWVVWPLTVATMAIRAHVLGTKAILTAVLMFAALNPGYGDDSKLVKVLKKKWVVWIVAGLAYAFSTCLIGWSFWNVMTAIYFPLGMALSNKWLPKWTHKYVEGFTGVFQGLAVAKQLAGV